MRAGLELIEWRVQLGTAVVGALMSGEAATEWVRANSGLMLIPMCESLVCVDGGGDVADTFVEAVGAIVAMMAVFWKRHSHRRSSLLLSATSAS